MALIDEVKSVCDRLAGRGWADLLRRVGLDIAALHAAALGRRLAAPIARPTGAIPQGFQDFAFVNAFGIAPGAPARSLLYHALASPYVHPTTSGQPSTDARDYPTLAELDLVENLIYATARRRLSDFPADVVTAVMAYQYRPGARTAHGQHGDFVFSRTGIARVGTHDEHYQPALRRFWTEPESGARGFAVMPSRYGVFLARRGRATRNDAILGQVTGDNLRSFAFPVHKLFPGDECLVGETITSITYAEEHRNDKLRRVHTNGRIPPLPMFDLTREPFVRTAGFASLRLEGASAFIVPRPRPLVATATQNVNGRNELVRFRVPRVQTISFENGGPRRTRFSTSFDAVTADRRGRLNRRSPEYVNIRHRVEAGVLKDLSATIADEATFLALVSGGGYEAAHFMDATADGALIADVRGLTRLPLQLPAYSIISAPDFFPLCDQLEIAVWHAPFEEAGEPQFAQGGPAPLSGGRNAVDPNLLVPGVPPMPAFRRTDDTITAMIGAAAVGTAQQIRHPHVLTTWLPDGASDVFAPGWDVSLGVDDSGTFTTTFGLGSPFPEDAKLCAALNSFWPAVAPDASRTFAGPPTAKPMLDEELGFHPDDPRVRRGEVVSVPGWDGEHGPFLFDENGQEMLNFVNLERSDYVSNALAGNIHPGRLAMVTSEELILRMEAFRFCIFNIPPNNDTIVGSDLVLASAEKITDWSTSVHGDPRLARDGYRFVFVRPEGPERPVRGSTRSIRAISNKTACRISGTTLLAESNGTVRAIPRPI